MDPGVSMSVCFRPPGSDPFLEPRVPILSFLPTEPIHYC